MIFYFSDISFHKHINEERKYKHSQAGFLRTIFVKDSLKDPVTIVSMATPEKKGFFKGEIKEINESETIVYLPGIQLNVFLNLILYFFYISFFIIFNINKNDKVIIYNMIPKQTLPIIFWKYLKGFELIVEVEELYSSKDFGVFKNTLNKFIEYWTFRIADKFIGVNSLIRNRIKNSKPYLISHGYPLKSEEKLNMSLDKESKVPPTIFYSGRLDTEGGIMTFLNAINYTSKECHINICGSGPLENQVKDYIKKLNNEHVNFLGYLKDEEYEELLASATICINPIRSDFTFSKFSFPSKVLNYLHSGNLVVSSDFYGIYDLPNDLSNKIFLFNNTSENLAEVINKVKDINYSKEELSKNTTKYFKKQRDEIREFIL